ncbi:MAG: F0F1 ATP synthase subunit B [Hyphomicrobiales bacterium]
MRSATSGGAQESTGAMPQLDFTSYPPQLIWLVIVFIGLYFVMSRVALPQIGGIIEQRRDRIASDLDDAARLKDESEKALAAYEAALAEAKAKAHGIAQETREKLNAETERQRAEVEATLAAKTAEAEARIGEAKDAAMGQIKTVATDTTGGIVNMLIGGRITKAKVTKAVDEIVKG